jgi:general stress protein 26
MKIQTQASAALTQLAELIRPIATALLTVTDDVAAARSSCLLTPLEMDSSGALWFFVDVRWPMVMCMHRVDLVLRDAGSSTCVWLSGRGEVTDDRARIERLWTASAEAWLPDGPGSPELLLLKVVVSAAEYWDAPSARLMNLFAPAAPVSLGDRLALGSFDVFTGPSRRLPQFALQ